MSAHTSKRQATFPPDYDNTHKQRVHFSLPRAYLDPSSGESDSSSLVLASFICVVVIIIVLTSPSVGHSPPKTVAIIVHACWLFCSSQSLQNVVKSWWLTGPGANYYCVGGRRCIVLAVICRFQSVRSEELAQFGPQEDALTSREADEVD